jgi:hypothetical protein
MLRQNIVYLLAAAVVLIITVLAVVLLLILEPVALPMLQWLRLPTQQIVTSESRHCRQHNGCSRCNVQHSTGCACA